MASEPDRDVLFADAVSRWMHHLEFVKGVKPSTLADYRYLLAPADAAPRHRGRPPAARIMRAFGDRPLFEIMPAEVGRYLASLDADPTIWPRTVNKHRQVLCTVFEHAMREDTLGLPANPAGRTDKRREPDAKPIDFYEVEEVLALVRTARAGRHRDPSRPAVSVEEHAERDRCDEQDAARFVVAGVHGAAHGRAAGAALAQRRLRRRGSSSRRAGPPACSPRPSRAGSARCHLPTSRQPCSRSSPRASASPAAMTWCSAARSAATWTGVRFGAVTGAPSGRRACGRCASTTCATPSAAS